VPPSDGHQQLLEAIKTDLNQWSVYTRFFNSFTPKTIHHAITAGGQAITYGLYALFSHARSFIKKEPTPSPDDIYLAYEYSHDVIKAFNRHLKKTAKIEPLLPTVCRYPAPHHHSVNVIHSPTRVFCDIMYLFNEELINHLTETRPAPSTVLFILSLGTYGAHFLPAQLLRSGHHTAHYFDLLPTLISQYFLGQGGNMASTRGLFAAVMQWQLASMAVVLVNESLDRNGMALENLTQNPEEILIALVTFVSLGYAIGLAPQLPLMPSKIPGISHINLYGDFINFLIKEAAAAHRGIMPLTSIAYGILGFKVVLLLESMASAGALQVTKTSVSLLLAEIKSQRLLDVSDASVREKLLLNTLHRHHIKDEEHIARFNQAIQDTIQQHSDVKNIHQAAQQDVKALQDILERIKNKPPKARSPLQKIKKIMRMLSDPETPLTFSRNKRRDAIQFYNYASQLFDEHNATAPKDQQLSKKILLNAFRNRFCSRGSHNLLRMLSFYPGNIPIPFRYLWRQAQLFFNNTPYVRDKIQASKEKDVVLRHQWIAVFKGSSYAFMNLVNRTLKLVVGIIPTCIILTMGVLQKTHALLREIITGRPYPTPAIKTRLMVLGRFLDAWISIANQLPTHTLRQRGARAAHTASTYSDVQHAGKHILTQIKHIEAETANATHNAPSTQRILKKLHTQQPTPTPTPVAIAPKIVQPTATDTPSIQHPHESRGARMGR
jgi:hypothetical protein